MKKLFSLLAGCFIFLASPVYAETCDTPEMVNQQIMLKYPGTVQVVNSTDQKNIKEVYGVLKIINSTPAQDPEHRLDKHPERLMMFVGVSPVDKQVYDVFISFEKGCADSIFMVVDAEFQQAVKKFNNQQT